MASHLTGFGRNWDLFIESCTYSYNSHIIPSINQSPYYLVYLREPPKLSNLEFTPLEEIKYSYHEYIEFLRHRLENVGKFMIKNQTRLQTLQAEKQMEKVKEPTKYKVGLLVFALCPGSSHLHTKSLKFKASFIGPLSISEQIGRDKCLLQDLEGRPLHGVFHVNRLKPGFIRLKHGSASTLEELQKELTKQEIESLRHKPFNPSINPPDSEHIILTILETDKKLTPQSTELPIGSCMYMQEQNVPIDLKSYVKYSVANDHIGSNKSLSERQIMRLKIRNSKMPNEGTDLIASKFRFKSGYLEMLLKPINPENSYSTWVAPHLHPNCCLNVTRHLENNRPIITGKPNKLARALFLKGSHHQIMT